MSEQADMFDKPRDYATARRIDPETSHEAARSLDEAVVSRLQRTALLALVRLGGSGTNDEIVTETGVEWNTITPRMRPLATKGMVREDGTRKSERTGRRQIVWTLTPAGRREAEQ